MLSYIAIIVPFGVLVTSIDINVTASANLTGDQYQSRNIILADASATLIAGLFGAVGQTTAYVGHSTYKLLGARTAYVLLSGIIVGLGGFFGLIGFLIDLIPDPIIQPILIIIGFDMARLAFHHTPKRHVVAVSFAIAPAILNFCYVKVSELWGYTNMALSQINSTNLSVADLFPLHWLNGFIVLGAMSNGYILVAMIWGATVAFMIDGKLRYAALLLLMTSVFSLFGIVHSVAPSASIYVPWLMELAPEQGIFERSLVLPYEIALGYFVASISILLLSLRPIGINHENSS